MGYRHKEIDEILKTLPRFADPENKAQPLPAVNGDSFGVCLFQEGSRKCLMGVSGVFPLRWRSRVKELIDKRMGRAFCEALSRMEPLRVF